MLELLAVGHLLGERRRRGVGRAQRLHRAQHALRRRLDQPREREGGRLELRAAGGGKGLAGGAQGARADGAPQRAVVEDDVARARRAVRRRAPRPRGERRLPRRREAGDAGDRDRAVGGSARRMQASSAQGAMWAAAVTVRAMARSIVANCGRGCRERAPTIDACPKRPQIACSTAPQLAAPHPLHARRPIGPASTVVFSNEGSRRANHIQYTSAAQMSMADDAPPAMPRSEPFGMMHEHEPDPTYAASNHDARLYASRRGVGAARVAEPAARRPAAADARLAAAVAALGPDVAVGELDLVARRAGVAQEVGRRREGGGADRPEIVRQRERRERRRREGGAADLGDRRAAQVGALEARVRKGVPRDLA